MESEYDYIITVTANTEVKIDRILKRDDTTEKKIRDIMKNQMPDEEKVDKSDFVIVNDRLEDTILQVQNIHKKILKKIGAN